MTRLVALLALAALVVATLATGARADARATSTPPAALEARIPAQLVPGTTAIVATGDGDCLRIRNAPGLDANRLTCAPDGSEVTVLDDTRQADDLRWQYVRFNAADGQVYTGWAADLYLVPAAAAPVPQPTPTPVAPPAPTPEPTPEPAPVCDTRGTSPGLFGSIPPQGGSALLVSGGGTSAGIVHQAALRGVTLRSLWVLNDAGNWIAYVVRAPDFVNQRWYDHFPGGRIPSSTALFAIAEASGTSSTATGGSIAPPLVPASEPRHVGGPVPEVEAAAAIVIDAASGAVLHEHNARTSLPPASLTKIVTAVLAIEGSDLDSLVSVDGNFGMLDPDSSLMGLVEGDCFTVRDLLYGLMLRSGNDAALAIARHVAGSDEAFVASMNAFVARLGLSDTQFGNPHGLHDDLTYSSAYDMAMVTRYAMTLPTFETIARAHVWETSGSRVFLMRNINTFLSSYDDGDGVKTGFTEEAGRTLVASATRDGRRVIAVLLDAPDRATDAAALIEWAFTEHDWPR